MKKASDFNWRPFDDARNYVHSLRLKNWQEWQVWAKSGLLPDDIPNHPSVIYKGKGWVSFGDWLGTGRIFHQKMVYRPFIKARIFVRCLGMRTSYQWKAWARSSKCPDDIPFDPSKIYKDDGWIGLKDWLGTELIYKYKSKKCSFEEARDFARSLGLHSFSEWQEWSKSGLRPNDIPAGPWSYYKGKGWINIGDWLGTGSISSSKRVYLPFEDAREYVRKLGLFTVKEWQEWAKSTKRPDNIPMTPHHSYKNKGWKGYKDWLGWIINIKKEGIRPFKEAREYARSLGLKNLSDWQAKAKSGALPDDIPYYPSVIYKGKGWVNFGDWLGTGRISFRKKNYRLFIEARIFVRSLGLKNCYEWRSWAKKSDRPDDIPAIPSRIYKDEGWAGLKDWLGTERIFKYKNKKCSFEEARDYARSLDLHNYYEWKKWSKSGMRPSDIPAGPWSYYKEKGWINIGDWLGTGSISTSKRVYLPFEEAREIVSKLNFNSREEWRKWASSNQRPIDIPISPHHVYRNKGWIGYGDWLGSSKKIIKRQIIKRKVYRPFEEAREYVQSLGLKNNYEWKMWAKSPECPDDIPSTPDKVYKDKGWAGPGDWLGIKRIYRYKDKKCSFEAARAYVQSLGLKNYREWQAWSKSGLRPKDIPSGPWSFYKGKGWVSMGDWLGIGHVGNSHRVYLPFEKAREFTRKLGLNNLREWLEWARSTKRPADIPITPHYVYRNKGWSGYGDWLGIGRNR